VTCGKDGRIELQGAITDMVTDIGNYEVTLFSWMTGIERGRYIVSFDELSTHAIFTGKNAVEHDKFCGRVGDSIVGHLPSWDRLSGRAPGGPE